MSAPTLHLLGRRVDDVGLDEVVEAFRQAALVLAGLVLPWDRAADAAALEMPASETRSGTLWSAEAECRWRVESSRSLVTVLADTSLPGLDLDAVPAAHRDEGAIRWLRAPFVRRQAQVDVRAMFPRLYLVGGVPAHRRTAIGG